MNELRTKERNARLRRELASWQVGTVGLLILATLVNLGGCWLYSIKADEAASWEEKYHAAAQIEREAVAAYGKLSAQVELERERRQEQAREFEALGKYQYIGRCRLTAYCCEPYEHICGTGDGLTATGIPAAPGVVAVDPKVIPLGSTVVIDGAEYLAADTGGAIDGLEVDVALTTHEEAEAFGVREADVWIIPPET